MEKLNSLVDCHAHLDLLSDASEEVAAAESAGVSNILAVGIDLESSRKAVTYAHSYSQVHASIGIHPHGAAAAEDKDFRDLEAMTEDDKVVAIGETGLDFYRDRAPREMQRDCFRRHIRLARETGLPLVVHSRDADEETLAILKAEAGEMVVILHCFALTDHVAECGARGYYMSVAGNVTFKNAAKLRDSIATIPAELLLTETDAPYLAPVPFRGRPNRPAYISHIIEAIASLRGTTADVLQSVVKDNYSRALNLAAPI
jgi:TatD DNase family protein